MHDDALEDGQVFDRGDVVSVPLDPAMGQLDQPDPPVRPDYRASLRSISMSTMTAAVSSHRSRIYLPVGALLLVRPILPSPILKPGYRKAS